MERVKIWSDRIAFQLENHNWHFAHRLVEDYKAEIEQAAQVLTLDSPIAELIADTRICNALEQYHNVRTIQDAGDLTELQLLGTPNVGTAQTAYIVASLREFASRLSEVSQAGEAC